MIFFIIKSPHHLLRGHCELVVFLQDCPVNGLHFLWRFAPMTAPTSVVSYLVALDVAVLPDVELRDSAVLYSELRRLFEMLDFKVEQLFADGRFAFRPVVGLNLDAVEIDVLRKLSLHWACFLFLVTQVV